jgi:hypothetical protein
MKIKRRHLEYLETHISEVLGVECEAVVFAGDFPASEDEIAVEVRVRIDGVDYHMVQHFAPEPDPLVAAQHIGAFAERARHALEKRVRGSGGDA